METVVIFYQMLVLIGLLLAFAKVIANVSCFRGLRAVEAPPADEAPLISVLVPARNEALNIEACVGSLLAQDYPRYELIVLDDHSEDGTGDIVRRLGLRESGDRRVISGEPLPAGWMGKCWACHQLSQAARGEFLFFTDADTTHAAGTLAASLAAAREWRADLLSAWPRQVTVTLGEQLVVPMIVLLGMCLYPHYLVMLLQKYPRFAARLPPIVRKSMGAANGQFLFFPRTSYDRIGGFFGMHDHIVEDVALGRAVAERMGEGMRLFNCESLDFSTCRMYRSFGETWEGFTKNIRASFEDSLAGFLSVGISHACAFFLPFIFVFTTRTAHSIIVAQIIIIYLIRVIVTLRFRTSWLGCILHPVCEALSLSIGLNSWRRMASKGVQWKGRIYQTSRGMQAK